MIKKDGIYKMKENKRREPKRYRLSNVSAKEIEAKYPDKVIYGYVESGRLVLVLDTCRIKFDERVPQSYHDKYGAIH